MNTAIISPARSYNLRPRAFHVHDGLSAEEEVDFHVQQGDYFPTLASILGLVAEFLEDAVRKGEAPRSFQIMALGRLKEDLMYLHKKYRIVPRPEDGNKSGE